eukprot:GSA120T00017457001.1
MILAEPKPGAIRGSPPLLRKAISCPEIAGLEQEELLWQSMLHGGTSSCYFQETISASRDDGNMSDMAVECQSSADQGEDHQHINPEEELSAHADEQRTKQAQQRAGPEDSEP